VTGNFPVDHITEGSVRAALESFIGERQQVPPVHSAKMIKGKRAYEFARKGIVKEMPPVTVFFREIELLSFDLPEIKTRMLCSKGTYLRSFARDLGIALGSGACLSALKRTAIGPFTVDNAYSIEKFENLIKGMKQN
jgi:tRNA pseudouridine55 synthase